MKLYNKVDILKDALGAEKLLEEFIQAMSSKELSENIEHIATCWDVDLEDNREE